MQAELAGSVRGPTFAELTARMELDFELARARSTPAALLRVEVERLERFAPEQKRRVLAAIGRHLAELAPAGGLVAACEGAELVVLLRESGVEQAEALARSWIAAARKLQVEGETAPVRASLAIGVAATRAGLDAYFETLHAVAREGLDVARSNGGECCVHSELYEFHQRKVERTKGPRAPVAPPVKPAAAAHAPSAASAAPVTQAAVATRPVPSSIAPAPTTAFPPGLGLAA
ncbi:MAG: GGDEF domain-containing protein, partial [Planctomycetes bacterium]|nr:GGDEF domain-containing protein [Planctomycetota bacterium]